MSAGRNAEALRRAAQRVDGHLEVPRLVTAAPPAPALSLRQNGSGSAAAFAYGTLPQVVPQLLSYTLYRWENNIRAAAILGVVGAGGLGQLLFYHLGLFHFAASGPVIIAMLVLVGLVDWASTALRERLTR